MKTDALIFMVVTYLVVTGVTVYFFYRALTHKPKSDGQ